MAKKERKRLSKEEAIGCLQRNGVRVVEEYNSKTDHKDRMVIWTRPIGLKVRSAVDCLCNYHKFSRVGKV